MMPKTNVSAAEIPDNIATNVTLTDTATGKEVTEISNTGRYQLNVDFKVPNGVHAGDTSTITLPDGLKFTQKTSFDVKSSDGQVVAKATIDPTSKKIILTYTDYAESHSDITGKITAPFGVDTSTVTKETTIPANIDIGKTTVKKGNIHYVGSTADSSDEKLAKWGVVTDSTKNEILYTLRVNAASATLKNVVISDTVASDGMSIVPGSFTFAKGKFTRDASNQWVLKSKTDITASTTATVSADGKSFSANVGDLDGVGVLVKYKVQLNHKPANGEIFTNTAKVKADNQTITLEETSKLVWQSASGEANGYNYTIRIKKTDEGGAALAGAVFKVVRDSSGGTAGTITTGADGTGSLGGLLRDNYTITETAAPDGYQLDTTPVTVTADELNNADKSVTKTVVNKKIPLISVSGAKTWNDGDNKDGKRPSSITVNLLADGVKVQSKTVTAADGWKYSFDNLPESKDGKKITYTVSEEAVPGYTTKVDGTNITNTYKPESTSVSVTKKWSDNNDQDGVRPSSVTVQLYADGKASGDPVTLNEANSWKHTWSGLDKNAAGKAIAYTVKEVSVPNGYTSAVTGDASSGYTVTNTHKPGVTSISGTKTWNDGDNQDGIRPKSITVNLLANGEKIQSKTVTADAAGEWKYSFENLPQSKDGKKIAYTVSEEAVTGYTTKVDGNNIINTHEVEKTSVSVEKQWADENDKDHLRPSSVKVQLYANGEASGEPVALNEANSWKHTWSGLDKNAAGKAIEYTVKEVSVPDGYTSEVTGDAASGFTITNTHTPVVPPVPPTPPVPPVGPKIPPHKPHRHLAKTGAGMLTIMAGGVALMAAGIAVLLLRRREAKQRQ